MPSSLKNEAHVCNKPRDLAISLSYTQWFTVHKLFVFLSVISHNNKWVSLYTEN